MKTRNGYVSNSSSSSFIFMYNDDSSLKINGKGSRKKSYLFYIRDFFSLIDELTDYSCEKSEVVANGFENVMDYLSETDSDGYSHYEQEYSSKIIDKMNKNKDKYQDAAIVRISYSDRIVRNFFEWFSKSGEILELDENED